MMMRLLVLLPYYIAITASILHVPTASSFVLPHPHSSRSPLLFRYKWRLKGSTRTFTTRVRPLSMADTTTTISTEAEEKMEELRMNDPLGYEVRALQKNMDTNEIINTGIIALIILLVVVKCTTVDSNIMRGWTIDEMAVRIPIDNWASYSQILDKQPISTKAVTSATVYTIGDIISQRTEGSTIGQLDRPRVVRSLVAGLIGHGPLSHVWYEWSEDIFTNTFHWTEWWSFVPKVAVDQTTWGPFWNNMYIFLLGTMKRESIGTIWSDMKRTTVPLIVSGLKLWPLAHCVTYGLIPVENRLLWVDMVEIIWVTILATQAASSENDTTTEAADVTIVQSSEQQQLYNDQDLPSKTVESSSTTTITTTGVTNTTNVDAATVPV